MNAHHLYMGLLDVLPSTWEADVRSETPIFGDTGQRFFVKLTTEPGDLHLKYGEEELRAAIQAKVEELRPKGASITVEFPMRELTPEEQTQEEEERFVNRVQALRGL